MECLLAPYRWKQIVGYDFNGGGFDGTKLEVTFLQLTKKAENIGLLVSSVTMNMGPSNIACWNAFRITAGRSKYVNNSIPHPFPKGDP